jgi:protocatechuate 4,5-dioxygenase alpha chain
MTVSNWQQKIPSPNSYLMNRILYDVHHQGSHLERYKNDPDAYMANFPLPAELKTAIRENDIGIMYLAGVNPLLLRAHCLGLKISESHFVESLRAVEDKLSLGINYG